MKRLLLLTLAVLASHAALPQGARIGVKGGLNITNMSNMDDLNLGDIKTKYKPSFHAGAFLEFKLGNLFALQPELLFSRQGTHAKNDILKVWLKNDYLTIPVLLKISPSDIFSIDIGPQLGFLLSSKIKAKTEGVSFEMNVEEMFKKFFNTNVKNNKIDLGLVLGFTLRFTDNLDFYGRYYMGFSDYLKDKPFDTDGGSDKKNRQQAIQLGVGYKF